MDCERVQDMSDGDREIRSNESTKVAKTSREGSLRIKIKMPKKPDEGEEHSDVKDAYAPPPPPPLPPPEKAELDVEMCTSSSDGSGSSVPGQKLVVLDVVEKSEKSPYVCTECSRTFKSAKSLHGHMRCHPERNYRGMNPSSSAVKVNVGLVVVSHFNPPRGKRGRKNRSITSLVTNDVKFANYEQRDPEVRSQVEYVAESLLMLSMGETDESLKRDAAAAAVASDGENQNHNSSESESNKEGSINNPGTNSPPRKKLKTGKETQSEQDQTKRYQCDICSRFFSTYQALGGHKASHNKGKNNNNMEECEILEEAKVGEAGNGEPSTDPKSPATKMITPSMLHQCKKCNAPPFATGQALGGHMRKHYQEDVVNGASKKPEDAITSASKQPLVPLFDLNEVPIADGEEMKMSTDVNMKNKLCGTTSV